MTNRVDLVSRLAHELANPSGRSQPRIERNPLPTLNKLDLAVIWDEWKGIPLEHRSTMILDAYEQSKQGTRESIYTAIGRTTEEAIALGYLPFRVAVASHRVADTDWDRIDAALRSMGAVETSEGLELRFGRLDEAQDAVSELEKTVPGRYWTIVEEVIRET